MEPNPINAELARKLGADDVIQFKVDMTDERNGWKAYPELVEDAPVERSRQSQ